MRTVELARAAGYSVQQVRDLERLGVLPPARRADNGYRDFDDRHLATLRAYRDLAVAVGPVAARALLSGFRHLPPAEAAARINDLHTELHREREEALRARDALLAIRAEGWTDETDSDALTVAELSIALAVRPSALRFWEREGLLHPDRVTSYRARRYPPGAVRDARIIVALRAAGYRLPAVREALNAARTVGEVGDPLAALDKRLASIAERTLTLVATGAELVRLLHDREA